MLQNAEPGALFALPDPVLAASRWSDNAALVADCARLGYLRKDWRTLDPTYGRGNWWTRWQPDELVAHDKFTLDGVDFTALPEPNDAFDAATYDPPYVCVGGRKTSGIEEMYYSYGLLEAPTTPAALQQLINAGLSEMYRVVRPEGIVLCKCQDYISSGKLWPGTHFTLVHALSLGFLLIDRLEHVGDARPQPGGRRQVHARRNLSTLFVLKVVG